MNYLVSIHQAARDNATCERYHQDQTWDGHQCSVPGEDAEKAPRWVQALPLTVVHRVYWPMVQWLRRRYLVQLAEILYLEILRVVVCSRRGHDFEDTGSWAGPDSGGEDMTCRRCNFNFHHIYY